MKVLAISYSYTGTCRKLRQALSARLGWAEGEITDHVPGRGKWRCVLDTVLRRRPRVRYVGPAPDVFDAVVLIAPIWLQKLAAPMRTFLAGHSALPRVALVAVMGGQGAPQALEEFTQLMGKAPVRFASFTQREVDDGSFVQPVVAFGRAIENLHEARSPIAQRRASVAQTATG
jgi:hypothetical protein